MKTRFAAGIVALFGFVSICSAGTSIELQSSYLGDGWFRYRMKTLPEPFLRHLDVQGFGFNGLSTGWPGYEYGTPPVDWQSGPTNHLPVWNYRLPYPSQQRPYEREFLVRSPEHTFRYATNATLIMTLDLVSDIFGNGVFSSIIGYVNLPCLVPCPPGQADGSPPDRTCLFKFIDTDMLIDSLLVTNGMVTGVTFSAGFKSTVLLEGSMDYSRWTNIAYIWGNPGATMWTTNTPLNDYGQFFRIELVAYNEHVTNLPPLSARPAAAGTRHALKTIPAGPTLTCRPQGKDVAIQFLSVQGQNYDVQAINQRGEPIVMQAVFGTGERIEVRFPAADLPNPVFFSAKPTP